MINVTAKITKINVTTTKSIALYIYFQLLTRWFNDRQFGSNPRGVNFG